MSKITRRDADNNEIEIEDRVGFKFDYEREGTVLRFQPSGRVEIETDSGEVFNIFPDRCWAV